MDLATNGGGDDSQNVAAKGAALLLVIGEPFSEEHKTLILEDITKGFRSWDVEGTGVDINDELAQIANRANLGEEGPNASPYGNQLKDGERVVRHQSDNLAAEILVNPQTATVDQAVRSFLSTPTKHKQLIYAGHAFQGTGAWVLQDDTYSFNKFAHAFKDQDVDNTIRQLGGATLNIFTTAEGDWSNGHISKSDFSKLLDVKLNPADKLDSLHGVLQFTAYVRNFVRAKDLNELLQSSDVVGNIRFSRPTLYIFPACQGDSALFGISGFNLLVNGGYSRKACFWDFTRHLDRIDAALMTHLGSDNLYGFKSVLQRKSIENVHPEIGFMYVNASEKLKPIADQDSNDSKGPNLQVNLAAEGNALVQYAKKIGQEPQSCSRSQAGQTIEPMNLYHKVGIGSLDMYILNPITDSKEMKDFYQQWNQNVAQFGLNQHVPLPNTLSICALLVWRPSDPNDNITRIFFPGNAPQHKVLEGLEKLKTLNILKQATCTKTTLSAKPAAKKPTGLSAKPPSKTRASPLTTPRSEVPKKEITPKTDVPKKDPFPRNVPAKREAKTTAAAPKPAVPKAKKEDVNKKTMRITEKTPAAKTEKPKDKAQPKGPPSKAPSSAKSSTPSKSTPLKTSTPKSATPSKTPSKTATPKSSTSSTPKGSSGPATPIKETKKEEVKEKPAKAPTPEPVPAPSVVAAAATDLVDLTPAQPEVVLNGSHQDVTEFEPQAPVQTSPEPLEAEPTPAEPEQPASLIDVQPEPVPEPAPQVATPEPAAMDKEKMRELGIYDEDEDLEDSSSLQQDSQESDPIPPQQSFGGMGDSMHQDLMGDFTAPSASQNLMQGSFHGDLMSGSMHGSMFDHKQPFDGAVIMENGSTNVDDLMSPDDDTSEEIQPQALPEPVAYAPESYGQESDMVPVVAPKEEQFQPEQATTPVKQEPDLLLNTHEADESENIDEESTMPVEDKQPVTIGTPDEVEEALPQDNEESEKDIPDADEKDISEDIEREVAAMEGPVEPSDIPTPQIEAMPGFETVPQKEGTPAVDVEAVQESDAVVPQVQKDIECQPEVDSEDEFQKEEAQLAQAAVKTETEPDFGLESAVDQEPELEKVERAESPDVEEVVERPQTPEPTPFEQEAQAEEPLPAKDVTESQPNDDVQPTESELDGDFNEDGGEVNQGFIDKEPSSTIEAPAQLEEQETRPEDAALPVAQVDAQPEEVNAQPDQVDAQMEDMNPDQGFSEEPFEQEKVIDQQELPPEVAVVPPTEEAKGTAAQELVDSEDERPESPDSQLGAQDMNRDSLERELDEKEQSPDLDSADDNMQRDSMERSSEERDSVPRDSEERDSVDRSFERGSEERDSVEREDGQKDTLAVSDDQRDSAERSFEDDSEETEETDDDEDEDDESSYEQEENTDEKCLLPGNPEDERPIIGGMKPLSATPSESQASEGLISPESEYTDASHVGQVGYHQVDEQDPDSVDGLEDREDVGGQTATGYQAQMGGDGFSPFGAGVPQGFESGPMSETNPFADVSPSGQNPFMSGYDQPPLAPQNAEYSDDKADEVSPSSGPSDFNPLSEWGKPMGLPSPAPPEDKTTPKKTGASNKPTSDKKAPKASNGVPDKSRKSLNTSTAANRLSTGGKNNAAPKTRPSTAPATKRSTEDLKKNGTKRPATAAGTKSSPAAAKMPPLPAFTPFYMDLTYIPNHGNAKYSDVEFFKRIRARYYVLSALSPNTQILDSLLEGKSTWEDKSLPVTVIPTYDNETLRLWMSLHKEKLADAKVEIAPSASRCTIQLQDHETSSSAYRLEF